MKIVQKIGNLTLTVSEGGTTSRGKMKKWQRRILLSRFYPFPSYEVVE